MLAIFLFLFQAAVEQSYVSLSHPHSSTLILILESVHQILSQLLLSDRKPFPGRNHLTKTLVDVLCARNTLEAIYASLQDIDEIQCRNENIILEETDQISY